MQIYIRPLSPALRRPPRELKAFAKVTLAPGESATLTFPLTARDFCHFDPSENRFVLRARGFVVEAAASSRDVRLSAPLDCQPEPEALPPLRTTTPADQLLAHPALTARVTAALQACLPLTEPQAADLVTRARGSFLGLYDTLTWYLGPDLSEPRLQEALDRA